jgi:F-box-like
MNRCPDDILKYIFETVVESAPDSSRAMEIAMRLSHVSHHWRTIALETPRIWRRLHTSLIYNTDRGRQNFQERWDTLCGRIKNVPADIAISFIGYSIPLENCNLSRIPKISRLCLHLTTDQAEDEVLQLSLSTKPPIDSLEFSLYPLWKSFDFDVILCHLPPARRLIFFGEGAVLLSGAQTYPTVRDIITEGEVYLDFRAVCVAFPGLTSVTGQDLSQQSRPFRTLPHPAMSALRTLPHLKHLSISGLSSPFWLRAISCPGLAYFDARGRGVEEEIIDFVSSNPSITTFKFHYTTGFDRLASETSKIEDLTIRLALYKKCQPSFQLPHFPKLRRLTIDDDEHELTVEDFEFLVCARCLPAEHPRSTLPPNAAPIESLTIVVNPYDIPRRPMWRQGDLYDEAEITMTKDYVTHEVRIDLRWIS